jgi:hypothetical protein
MYGGVANQDQVLSLLAELNTSPEIMPKRARLWRKRLPRTRPTISRLYLGLTQARLGDNQAGLQNIEASMKRIIGWLNYLEGGGYADAGWDPGGAIRGSTNDALAMISSGKVDWNKLFVYGESVGLGVERSEANFRQQFIDSTRLWGPRDLIEKSQLHASKLRRSLS